MAIGALHAGGIVAASTGWQQFDAARAAVEIRTGASLAALPSGGPLTDNLPISEMPTSLNGGRNPGFVDDYYDRIHFSTLRIDLGNVIGEQQRTVTVWNAYRSPQELTGLTLDNAEGIEIAAPGDAASPPFTFRALQQVVYSIAVSTTGPASIDASISWDFDGHVVAVEIAGSRVIAWTWPPDWSERMLERLEWLTNVLRAYRGEEQARSLRTLPRQKLEFTATAEGDARRHMEAVLWNWGARVFAVPLWYDGLELAAPLAIGATSIPIDPELRDFRANTLALLLGENSRSFEVIEVASVTGSSIELARPTLQAWPVGTMVYPARAARIDGEAGLPRFTGEVSTARLRFEMVEPAEWAADAGTLYRGYPVLEDRPDWSQDLDLSMDRKLAMLDASTGPVAVEDEAQMPFTLQRMRWLLRDRAEIDAYRKRAFALRGKKGRIWVPTWSQDLVPVAPVSSVATTIDVRWCGYTTYLSGAVNRKDIRIELTDGTVLYRRITGTTEVDADTERLSLDAALGVAAAADEFLLVSFLSLARQDSDALELAWFTGEAAESASTLRSMRHGV
jgi:hypothetical protein